MSVYSPIAEQPVVFDEKLIAKIARRRARAHSWESIATEFRWDTEDLCYACDVEPQYAAALARAQKEVEDEADAEGMHKLRELLRDQKSAVALDAAKVLTKYLADKRRDATRLEVEKLRAEAKIASANARREKKLTKQEQQEQEVDNYRPTPEEEARDIATFWRQQEQHLEEALKPGATVYVWGGTHRMDQAPTEDDPRVMIFKADGVPGYPRLHWVMGYPEPTHIFNGPFPAPRPVPQVHECPPEVAEKLAAQVEAPAEVRDW